MPRKNLHYYLLKTARISGWLLIPLMLLFVVTGFAMRGEFGCDKLLKEEHARVVHQDFRWPLLAVLVVHVTTTIYFSLRRWGWIKRKTRK